MENKIHTNSEEWEKICLRCGQCCHTKLKTKHIFIIDPNNTCQHLKNGSCDIYENRLQTGRCVHIKDALEIDNMLPTSCPYTQFKPGYKGFTMPDQETFDYTILMCLIIENEEKTLGRDLTKEEIQHIEITQEKIDKAYSQTKNGYSVLFFKGNNNQITDLSSYIYTKHLSEAYKYNNYVSFLYILDFSSSLISLK